MKLKISELCSGCCPEHVTLGTPDAELAARIGITQRKYSYIETETQPLTDEMLVKLADFYNVSVDYILLRTEKPELNI